MKSALAGGAQLAGALSHSLRGLGFNLWPSRGMCGKPQLGGCGRQPIDVSFSLSPRLKKKKRDLIK